MARDKKAPKAEQKSKRREVQQVVGRAKSLADAHAQMLGEQPGVTLAEGATIIEQDALDQGPPPPIEPASPEEIRERQTRAEETGEIKDVAESLADILDEMAENEPEVDGSDSDEGPEGEADADAEFLEVEGDPLVTVKVNGEDVVVSLSEALNGYSRQTAFTKNSMQLADERREFTREREQTAEMAESLAQRMEFLGAVFSRNLSPEQRATLNQMYGQTVAARDEINTRADGERLAEEAQLLRENLGWDSDEDAQAGKTRLQEAAAIYGFDSEDLSKAKDHRLLVMLSDAASWRESQERASEVRGELRSNRRKSPTLRPGTPRAPVDRSKQRQAKTRERLRQTGSMQDGAEAIAALPGLLD